MKQSQALLGFAALSQDTRLEILRLLVRAGPEGLAAGVVAEEVGTSPSNLSFHLKELERAGLISARREARSILYSAVYASLRELVQFLTEDCCAGRREVCGPTAAGKASRKSRTAAVC
jgi:DNA-binding transcriptional ArsR family regulator